MDHFFQIRSIGPSEQEMLEAYTTLGFLAAHTRRAKLMTFVTGVHYRYPGILAKIVTTLDVLSGGRAWLGIGAGWNEEESRALGCPFLRSKSASRCWTRHWTSVFKCGAATRRRTRATTSGWRGRSTHRRA